MICGIGLLTIRFRGDKASRIGLAGGLDEGEWLYLCAKKLGMVQLWQASVSVRQKSR
jgi:hypothetical protein